ncbi:alpha/beta fold hydrolase [Pseudonocardia sp. HH130630-07]|uniref:alpha/beta fold hydrolase n=1 Tax=Pseudonocardia sp. HH130630-07 TaxID=1690815 RepID=UPI001E29F4A3|nr:alpha/beta fold hydrolase [Pseudonocardia sp. HH130630-07]
MLGPSLGTDLHLFDVQVDALGDEFRIVRYDLPGHGASPAPAGPYTMAGLARDVVALLDRLAIGRVHYVGVSIGGAIGQQIALDFPGRLTTLTVLASAARFAEPSSWPSHAQTVRARGTSSMVTSRPGVWLTHEFVDTHNEEAVCLLRMLGATDPEGYAGCCEAIGAFDVRRRLPDITVPYWPSPPAPTRPHPRDAEADRQRGAGRPLRRRGRGCAPGQCRGPTAGHRIAARLPHRPRRGSPVRRRAVAHLMYRPETPIALVREHLSDRWLPWAG